MKMQKSVIFVKKINKYIYIYIYIYVYIYIYIHIYLQDKKHCKVRDHCHYTREYSI